MKIIILGAGQVGTTLAANLVSEDNDITLVDNESQHLQNLQDKHDLRVVKGSPFFTQDFTRCGSSRCGLDGCRNRHLMKPITDCLPVGIYTFQYPQHVLHVFVMRNICVRKINYLMMKTYQSII